MMIQTHPATGTKSAVDRSLTDADLLNVWYECEWLLHDDSYCRDHIAIYNVCNCFTAGDPPSSSRNLMKVN